MIGAGNHQDAIHRPTLARDFAALLTRVAELERVARIPVKTHDAGGQAWTSANDEWISPNNVLVWTELRLSNTNEAAQIWRAVPTAGGNEWKRLV